MKKESALSHYELLRIDSLITYAQERGLTMNDKIKYDTDQTEGFADLHEATWATRHDGYQLGENDKAIFAKIRELAAQIEFAPTLGELIQYRAEALRQSGKQQQKDQQ